MTTSCATGISRLSVLNSGFWILLSAGLSLASVWTIDGTDTLLDHPDKLEFRNVSLLEDGRITLAPALNEKAAPSDNSVWQVCRTSDGSVYLGTGPNGRLYRWSHGRLEKVHESGSGEVMAVAADAQANVYFAVTPDAKVMRLVADTSEQHFDTHEKYVFALLPATDGALYCATGENGKLYRITGREKGTEVFAAPQAHITALAWLVPDKELLAGTSPDGVVYRLTFEPGQARARVQVLYDTPLDEVRSILIAGNRVYIGANAGSDSRPDSGACRVYCVDLSGTLRWSWSAPDSILFAISTPRSRSGRPATPLDLSTPSSVLVATGNSGLIYALDTLGRASVVHKTEPKQVLCLLPSSEGTWLGTGNTARLYLTGKDYAGTGYLESPPFDCQNPARFGSVSYRADVPAGTEFDLDTRTGNSEKPDSTWTDWLASQGTVRSPSGRFIQWRARLSSSFPDRTPTLSRTSIYYRIGNRPPQVRKLEVAGLPPDEARRGNAKPTRTITWEATDPDADSLAYDLFFRREDEPAWQQVQKDITDSKFDLDTRALSDGWYEVRLVASDHEDRVAGSALSAELVSRPFVVDNTAPVISDLRFSRGSPGGTRRSKVTLSFTATDALSPLVACRVTSNAGDWLPAEPADGLFDAEQESFSIELELEPGATTIAVWVADAQGNQGTARIRAGD